MEKFSNGFSKRLKTMTKVDFRRMFTSRFFFIMLGIALVMPVLILVMTTLMDGSVSVDPQTGAETVIEGFDNVWQIIGSVSSQSQDAAMSMGLTTMCNINLVYFMVAVLVCVFVADDFRSGYAKNLFTVRSNKTDYVISKTLVTFVGGASLILAFFVGSMIGGAVAGLPFDIVGASVANVVMCLLSKLVLMLAIVPIYVVMSVFAKQKLWLSLLLSLAGGALLFTMIPMITPLNSTLLNVVLCLAGGAMFGFGLSAVSRVILNKCDIL